MASHTSADGRQSTPPGMPSTQSLLVRASGQQRALGRFGSHQNAVEIYKRTVQNIKKHGHTVGWSPMFTDDIDPIVYGNRLFMKVVDSLASQHLQTSRMRIVPFEWLMPQPDATPDHLAIYDKLYTSAPIVSNSDLQKILKMERSTSTSPPLLPDCQYFYLRTLELTGDQLRELVDFIRDSDDGFEETAQWRMFLDLHHTASEGGTNTFTLRYLGTVSGPKRPIDRHMDDLLSAKMDNILGEVYRAIETLFPALLDNIEVYLLPEATQDDESSLFAEDVERFLIEMMHPPSLLNRQRGGYYSSFLPSQQDADLFAALKTDVWNLFNQNGTLPNSEMLDALAVHFDSVQQYAIEFPAETGTARHDFTDGVKNVTEAQATPNQYRGTILAAFIGKDITYTDYMAEKSFWDGGSRAAVLTKDMLQRIVDTEADSNGRGGFQQTLRSTGSLWCFADLWPWLWRTNSEQAVYFLRSYLAIIRPLVVVTYSRPVNSVTRANFVHQHGVSSNAFTPIVGDPTIQLYHDATDSSANRDDFAFINIAHIHPGRDKHSSQDVRLRRLMEATMQLTFAVLNLAMQTIDAHANDEVMPSRFELCREVLRGLKHLRKQPPHQQFFVNFEDIRRERVEYFTREAARSSNEDVRPLLNTNGRLKLASLGQAEGQPNSQARREQLDRLWDLKIPDLHLAIPHTGDQRDLWIKSFLTLQPGQYLFLTVLSQLDPEGDDYLKQLLSTFAPAGASGDAWMKNKAARGNAIVRAGLWIQNEAAQQNDAGRKTRLRVHYPQAFLSAYDLQNSPIGIVTSSGIAQIRWRKDGKTNRSIRVSCKVAVPDSPTETRVLHFTAEGIDILDATGNAFRKILAGGQRSRATIPRTRFRDDTDLTDLWRAVLTAHNIDLPEDEDASAPATDWGEIGVAALTQKRPRSLLSRIGQFPIARMQTSFSTSF